MLLGIGRGLTSGGVEDPSYQEKQNRGVVPSGECQLRTVVVH
jgi:hypothetical protein